MSRAIGEKTAGQTVQIAATASIELDGNSEPWAGPISSQATGAPDPSAGTVHWVERNAQVSAFVNSTYNDPFQHPGLPIRYVPYSYVAYGAANPSSSFLIDEAARADAGVRAALISARSSSPNSAFTTPVATVPRTRPGSRLRVRISMNV